MKPYKTPMHALIICGGNSERMGSPKALLNYHGMPQYKWMQVICKQIEIPAAISCKEEHAAWYEPNTTLIFDLPQFAQAGPMTGLLSAMQQIPEMPIILLGCDYPLLSIKDLLNLIAAFETHQQTVAFYQESTSLYEPMLAIYHPKDFITLQQQYKNRQNSLQNYLNWIKAIPVKAQNADSLKSFDTPEDFLSFR